MKKFSSARRERIESYLLWMRTFTLLALSGSGSPSVVRIRIEGLRGNNLSEIIQDVLRSYGEDLQQGAVVSVTENRARLRRLPL